MQIARDDAADEAVRGNSKLQDHIHARIVILWLPGMSAGIGVQLCLMIAGIGIALAMLFFWPLVAENFLYYIVGVALGSLPMAILSNCLVRGVTSARKRMLYLGLSYVCTAAMETALFALLSRAIAAKIAAVGLLASLAAVRLIAGPSYALLAAIYRAQRTRLQSLKRAAALRENGL